MSQRIVLTLLVSLLLPGCPTAKQSKPAARNSNRFSLKMNYDGAEALLAVLKQRTVTDADIDKLLAIRGVQAMVDNTTKYVPSDTRDTFRAAVKEFVTTRKSTIRHFGLGESSEKAAGIRALIAELKANANLVAEVTEPIIRYMPPLPRVTATVYGVTGGASDGFVLDGEAQPAFYMALNRAEGDVAGVKLNMTHELYHVVQRMARARVPGLNAKVFNPETAPAEARLLTVILEEGTATYVTEPVLPKSSFFRRSGPYIKMWRASYEKNASPEKIGANFAEVDRILSGLRHGSMTWKQASDVVFIGSGPGPYFVGYEMAKAIDRRHGPARIASLLQQHPAAFFRAYIDLYRENPAAVPARFSKETEAYIDSISLQ
ncbi:MAG TPA: DUF5700 domain-containing putative Zn-dependent protease [Thermoanaerobaculia bacterium]|jgi:hypothetical protein|nr:DUF5700 domain-containing putative Zn-dependent protease [Thermoanaerobaculia bacterium]